MSYHEYRASLEIAAEDYPFYALVMALMRRADSDNLAKLLAAFPETWEELNARYHSSGQVSPDGVLLRPAGLLPDEPWHAEAAQEERASP